MKSSIQLKEINYGIIYTVMTVPKLFMTLLKKEKMVKYIQSGQVKLYL